MNNNERRESLNEEAIEKTVRKTLEAMNGQKEEIADRVARKVLEKHDFGHTIKFDSEEEKKEFEETFEELSDLNKNIKTTKRRSKWLGLLFLAYILQDFFDFIIQIWYSFWDFVNTINIGGN